MLLRARNLKRTIDRLEENQTTHRHRAEYSGRGFEFFGQTQRTGQGAENKMFKVLELGEEIEKLKKEFSEILRVFIQCQLTAKEKDRKALEVAHAYYFEGAEMEELEKRFFLSYRHLTRLREKGRKLFEQFEKT